MNQLQQQQMLQQQQPGIMSMDVMQGQQQQYGGGYGGPADSQQVQRLLRPGPPMGQQMHQQNVMMQGVPQQQQHPMQMQQGGVQGQQQMMPGQTMMGGRPMVMQQQQGGRMVAPSSYDAYLATLPNDLRQKILQEPPERRPMLVRKVMDMQRSRMAGATRPQQWSTGAGGDTMVSSGQQPAHQFGGGTTSQMFPNQMVPTNQTQPAGYPAQRHPGIVSGQIQQQPGMLPQQQQPGRMYDTSQPANQPMTYPNVGRQLPSQVAGQQTLQPHQQQQQQAVNPYSHPAGPSPGGYSNLAYPSPSSVHPLSSGTSPGYAAADASPGYGNLPIMNQKMPEPSPLPSNSVEQPSSATVGSADDVQYKEKIRELQIYMDHLKRTLEQSQREGNVQNKVQKFIDILEGRSKVSYDVLLKCEDNLKKQAASRRPAEPDSKASVCQPFLDAVVSVVANKPNANVILKRTFDFPWKNIPAGKRICPPQIPTKKLKREIKTENDDLEDSCESTSNSKTEKSDSKRVEKVIQSVPLTIQREVASLEPKFRIVLDKTKSSLSVDEKMIHVLCDIEDSSLPLVPSLKIRIPLDYPMANPKCNFDFDEYSGTPIFDDIKRHLGGKFSKLSGNYSITTLLTNWELCVRQACAV